MNETATRMSPLARTLPGRILVVDDDELELELMADRIAAAGFEVARALHGAHALELLQRQWYPLVVTDWQMPVMDGIALTEELRSRAADDTYIIMLTMRETGLDYERGYGCGVDDYLTKRVPDPELLARIHAGFNTVALRRSLKRTESLLDAVAGGAQRTAAAPLELQVRLDSEVRRALRYGRNLSVLTIGVQTLDLEGTHLVEVVRSAIDTVAAITRAHMDWTGRLEAAHGAAFAVILPETDTAQVQIVGARLLAALRRFGEVAGEKPIRFSLGAATLDGSDPRAVPDGNVLLAMAEQDRLA